MTPSSSSDSPSNRLLEMRRVVKSFPGVNALRGVDLDLSAGEVLALLGENGAGKSTLIKILGGVHTPDAGDIFIRQQRVTWASPLAAQRAGIAVIYQEFNLVPTLTARENIFLGQEPARLSWLRVGSERIRAKTLFERLGAAIDPEATCRELTVAQQQIVEIAKALATHAKIIVMDEPSAALSPREVSGLFRIIHELKSQGIGIIYVSHRLDEIFEVADRVSILRDGSHVATRAIGEITRAEMIELMVGRKLEDEFPKRTLVHSQASSVAQQSNSGILDRGLSVRSLQRKGTVRNVSFDVRRGEIVALTGLVGAGRTEVARLIFGADRPDDGQLFVDGRACPMRSPRHAISRGICLLTEDRKHQGLVLGQTVLENFGLPNMCKFAPHGWINRRAEREAFGNHVRNLQIKITGPGQSSRTLSGGNQQKIVLAKWLERNADIIIFDEPTRGIDVGAKFEIYTLMNRLVAADKAVLMISSELPEVLGMADRILVMHAGRITGEICDVASATQADVLKLAVQ